MNKKIIAISASVLLFAIGYYGSYLPLRKSRAFIAALRESSSAASVVDFLGIFSRPIAMHSPIGQEEVVRNSANSLAGAVEQSSDPEVVGAIMKYVEDAYQPIIKRKKGMSFGQNLYMLGFLNEIAALRTRNEAYLAAARNYFLAGHEAAPRRPQPLYGLFEVYRIAGARDEAIKIGTKILEYWPNDGEVQKAMAELKTGS